MLTVRRIVNVLRAEGSCLIARFGRVSVRHLPLFVSVEPANFCQLRCPECPVNSESVRNGLPARSGKMLFMELFDRLLEQVAPTATTMQFYFQGEPLLNPLLPEMVAKAHRVGLYTITSTNAQALTARKAHDLVAAGLDRIIVSIDGLSQESYAAYRTGGSLDKALEGLRLLCEAKDALKGRTLIELQCLRLRTNEHEWRLFLRRYRQLGADILVFKTAQLYDYAHGHPLMPSDTHYSRYLRTADGLYRPKNRLHPSSRTLCRRLWTGCVMDAEGNIRACCYDKGGEYIFGNVSEQPFPEIWFGDKANRFRHRVLFHRSGISICGNCGD